MNFIEEFCVYKLLKKIVEENRNLIFLNIWVLLVNLNMFFCDEYNLFRIFRDLVIIWLYLYLDKFL